MNISTLIATSVRDLFDREPQRLGVRICPITLTAKELVDVVAELQRTLGAKAFVVGSAPGVALKHRERTILAPDHRAAEQATDWRNKVDVGAGEHLVYVSVEEHPKASGLRDCLVPVRESDLRAAFREWCGRPDSGMPTGFAEALKEAGLTDNVRVASLCELASAVETGTSNGSKWEIVGKSLPLIGLVADGRLAKKDAADRLAANAKMVRALDTGESRRRSGKGPLGELESKLHSALAGKTAATRVDGLAAVDLRTLTTNQLSPPKKPKSKPKPAGQLPKPGVKGRGSKLVKKASEAQQATEPKVERKPASGTATPATDGKPTPVPDRAAAEREAGAVLQLHAPPLPRGLAVLVNDLLSGDGHPVEVSMRIASRSALHAIPKTCNVEVRRAERVLQSLGEPFSRWAEARRALVSAAMAGRGHQDAGALLSFALPRLLQIPSVSAALTDHLGAAARLYEAALDVDAETMREVICLDTCVVRDASGVAVRVVGPLHLLAIGQVQSRERATHGLSEAARQRVMRALIAAPPAPADLVQPGEPELPMSRPEGGLLVFERTPEVTPEHILSEVAETLLRRYIELCPHALLGMRVAVDADRQAGALIEGLARAASGLEESKLSGLEVLCTRPPELPKQGVAGRLLAAGVLTLGPLPTGSPPHLAIRVPPAPRAGAEEPAPPVRPAFSPPLSARTVFELREGRLRVRTSIAGNPELEAFEALQSAALGRAPQAAFIRDTAGSSLRAEVEKMGGDDSTWSVVIAPSVGRRPPLRSFLVAHERFDDHATCAVVSRDVRPASRAIQASLRKVGLREERPRTLQLLATRLAEATRSGLVSLRRSGDQLVAAGLLAIEIGRRSRGTVIAPLEGAAYESLVGEPHDDRGVTLLGVTADGGSLAFFVGYATLDPEVDVVVSKPEMGGALARRLGHAIGTIHAAIRGDGPASEAAREALSWLIWPSLATDGAPDAQLATALSGWRGDPQAVEVVCLLPTGYPIPRGQKARIGKTPVTLQSIDTDLIARLLLAPI